jgi:hypothetical protein
VSADVFEKDPSRLDFADDAGNIGPQVPLVVLSLALPGRAERLTVVNDCPVRDVAFVLLHCDIEHVSGSAWLV